MLKPLASCCTYLAFEAPVASVSSLQFSSATVQIVNNTFSRLTSTTCQTPAYRTILPFNSTTITIPWHNSNFSTWIGLRFLPFAAGSRSIVSLDNANGSNIINISNIISVLPSPNNLACIQKRLDGVPSRTFFSFGSYILVSEPLQPWNFFHFRFAVRQLLNVKHGLVLNELPGLLL